MRHRLPGLVRVYGVEKIGSYYAITQELLKRYDVRTKQGCLHDIVSIVKWSPRRSFKEVVARLGESRIIRPRHRKLAREICTALESLRQLGYHHGDIHTGNFMRTRRDALRLIDFSEAYRVE